MKFKLIGFDLDGTLVDSLPDLALSLNSALSEFALPNAPEELVLTWIGNGADILLARALEWTGRSDEFQGEKLQQLKQCFSSHYGKNVCNKSRLYPNVRETLEALHSKGYLLAVVTNKPTKHVLPVLKAFKIDHLFVESLGGQSLPVIKPHPAPLYYLCGKFGLYPYEMLFVGDSKNDILAAKAVGCQSVGLTYGYNYNLPIADSQPDYVFDDFAKLVEIV
ncbi:Phosphoglycolate phosphatase [Bibersteinia trehalosi USDA-ARS-USMARC-188]|uniref:Phosphoglycolate phosphatase n=2 Tax=Bibersteinia trehalosi TaxID=47735 RepID=A0A4V7I7K8_BIBTR|nr:phosphoglycolate phosphatase [Bibersteinia trehalosi]AGH39269.1 Phosphoglycolate phosphatase [Bibersteinia trehalosi USDA-ARS-USMARC-192]AHG80985.1 Phosphoglycolate phosphatase [Bibersteinia trehalosi USDA-ARS-USMARC-188]AHG83197.1 Phosphoglycolate phosphatase [Bibersteinia trehalosi USDA-ARS-USMARC-189]TCT15914.1 phosphoglycolate phosphatase [Bibersteinia trehalosi]